jgi:hypothetical protein
MTVEKPVAAGEIVALWLSIISDHAAIDTQVVLVVLRRLTSLEFVKMHSEKESRCRCADTNEVVYGTWYRYLVEVVE